MAAPYHGQNGAPLELQYGDRLSFQNVMADDHLSVSFTNGVCYPVATEQGQIRHAATSVFEQAIWTLHRCNIDDYSVGQEGNVITYGAWVRLVSEAAQQQLCVMMRGGRASEGHLDDDTKGFTAFMDMQDAMFDDGDTDADGPASLVCLTAATSHNEVCRLEDAFRILPRGKIREEGEPVRPGEQVVLESVAAGAILAVGPPLKFTSSIFRPLTSSSQSLRRGLDLLSPEHYPMLRQSSACPAHAMWCIDIFDTMPAEAQGSAPLTVGTAVTLLHKESEAYLEGHPLASTDVNSDGVRFRRSLRTDQQDGAHDDLPFTSNAIWVVESPEIVKGGLLLAAGVARENMFRLRHLSSGRYLCAVRKAGGRGGFKLQLVSSLQGAHDAGYEDPSAMEGSLLGFYPLDEAEECITETSYARVELAAVGEWLHCSGGDASGDYRAPLRRQERFRHAQGGLKAAKEGAPGGSSVGSRNDELPAALVHKVIYEDLFCVQRVDPARVLAVRRVVSIIPLLQEAAHVLSLKATYCNWERVIFSTAAAAQMRAGGEDDTTSSDADDTHHHGASMNHASDDELRHTADITQYLSNFRFGLKHDLHGTDNEGSPGMLLGSDIDDSAFWSPDPDTSERRSRSTAHASPRGRGIHVKSPEFYPTPQTLPVLSSPDNHPLNSQQLLLPGRHHVVDGNGHGNGHGRGPGTGGHSPPVHGALQMRAAAGPQAALALKYAHKHIDLDIAGAVDTQTSASATLNTTQAEAGETVGTSVTIGGASTLRRAAAQAIAAGGGGEGSSTLDGTATETLAEHDKTQQTVMTGADGGGNKANDAGDVGSALASPVLCGANSRVGYLSVTPPDGRSHGRAWSSDGRADSPYDYHNNTQQQLLQNVQALLRGGSAGAATPSPTPQAGGGGGAAVAPAAAGTVHAAVDDNSPRSQPMSASPPHSPLADGESPLGGPVDADAFARTRKPSDGGGGGGVYTQGESPDAYAATTKQAEAHAGGGRVRQISDAAVSANPNDETVIKGVAEEKDATAAQAMTPTALTNTSSFGERLREGPATPVIAGGGRGAARRGSCVESATRKATTPVGAPPVGFDDDHVYELHGAEIAVSEGESHGDSSARALSPSHRPLQYPPRGIEFRLHKAEGVKLGLVCSGSQVTDIMAGGTADAAGLTVGMSILSVAGRSVGDDSDEIEEAFMNVAHGWFTVVVAMPEVTATPAPTPNVAASSAGTAPQQPPTAPLTGEGGAAPTPPNSTALVVEAEPLLMQLPLPAAGGLKAGGQQQPAPGPPPAGNATPGPGSAARPVDRGESNQSLRTPLTGIPHGMSIGTLDKSSFVKSPTDQMPQLTLESFRAIPKTLSMSMEDQVLQMQAVQQLQQQQQQQQQHPQPQPTGNQTSPPMRRRSHTAMGGGSVGGSPPHTAFLTPGEAVRTIPRLDCDRAAMFMGGGGASGPLMPPVHHSSCETVGVGGSYLQQFASVASSRVNIPGGHALAADPAAANGGGPHAAHMPPPNGSAAGVPGGSPLKSRRTSLAGRGMSNRDGLNGAPPPPRWNLGTKANPVWLTRGQIAARVGREPIPCRVAEGTGKLVRSRVRMLISVSLYDCIQKLVVDTTAALTALVGFISGADESEWVQPVRPILMRRHSKLFATTQYACAFQGPALRPHQRMLFEQDVHLHIIKVLKLPFTEGKLGVAEVAAPEYRHLHCILRLCYRLIRQMVVSSPDLAVCLTDFSHFFWEQSGYSLSTADTLHALVEDNEPALGHVSTDLFEKLARLVARFGRSPSYLNVLAALCVCKGRGYTRAQKVVLQVLVAPLASHNLLYRTCIKGRELYLQLLPPHVRELPPGPATANGKATPANGGGEKDEASAVGRTASAKKLVKKHSSRIKLKGRVAGTPGTWVSLTDFVSKEPLSAVKYFERQLHLYAALATDNEECAAVISKRIPRDHILAALRSKWVGEEAVRTGFLELARVMHLSPVARSVAASQPPPNGRRRTPFPQPTSMFTSAPPRHVSPPRPPFGDHDGYLGCQPGTATAAVQLRASVAFIDAMKALLLKDLSQATCLVTDEVQKNRLVSEMLRCCMLLVECDLFNSTELQGLIPIVCRVLDPSDDVYSPRPVKTLSSMRRGSSGSDFVHPGGAAGTARVGSDANLSVVAFKKQTSFNFRPKRSAKDLPAAAGLGPGAGGPAAGTPAKENKSQFHDLILSVHDALRSRQALHVHNHLPTEESKVIVGCKMESCRILEEAYRANRPVGDWIENSLKVVLAVTPQPTACFDSYEDEPLKGRLALIKILLCTTMYRGNPQLFHASFRLLCRCLAEVKEGKCLFHVDPNFPAPEGTEGGGGGRDDDDEPEHPAIIAFAELLEEDVDKSLKSNLGDTTGALDLHSITLHLIEHFRTDTCRSEGSLAIVLRVLRRMIYNAKQQHGTAGMIAMQDTLDDMGGTVLMTTIIENPHDEETVFQALLFGIALLEDGNVQVQGRMMEYFETLADEKFFSSLRIRMQRAVGVIKEAQISDKRRAIHTESSISLLASLNMAHVEKPPAFHSGNNLYYVKETLRLLQLFCEGHNLPLQHYIRSQPDNLHSLDLVKESILVLKALVCLRPSMMDSFLLDTVVQDFNSLTEYCQGPCKENQTAIVNSHIANEVAVVLSTDYAELTDGVIDQEEVDVARNAATITLLALLEGCRDREVPKVILRTLDLGLIGATLDQCWTNRKAGALDGDDSALELGFNLFIFMETLSAFDDQGFLTCNRYFMRDEAGYTYFHAMTGRIEISRDAELERVYFRIPELCMNLSEATRKHVLWTVDRETPAARISSFFAMADDVLFEMRYNDSHFSERVYRQACKEFQALWTDKRNLLRNKRGIISLITPLLSIAKVLINRNNATLDHCVIYLALVTNAIVLTCHPYSLATSLLLGLLAITQVVLTAAKAWHYMVAFGPIMVNKAKNDEEHLLRSRLHRELGPQELMELRDPPERRAAAAQAAGAAAPAGSNGGSNSASSLAGCSAGGGGRSTRVVLGSVQGLRRVSTEGLTPLMGREAGEKRTPLTLPSTAGGGSQPASRNPTISPTRPPGVGSATPDDPSKSRAARLANLGVTGNTLENLDATYVSSSSSAEGHTDTAPSGGGAKSGGGGTNGGGGGSAQSSYPQLLSPSASRAAALRQAKDSVSKRAAVKHIVQSPASSVVSHNSISPRSSLTSRAAQNAAQQAAAAASNAQTPGGGAAMLSPVLSPAHQAVISEGTSDAGYDTPGRSTSFHREEGGVIVQGEGKMDGSTLIYANPSRSRRRLRGKSMSLSGEGITKTADRAVDRPNKAVAVTPPPGRKSRDGSASALTSALSGILQKTPGGDGERGGLPRTATAGANTGALLAVDPPPDLAGGNAGSSAQEEIGPPGLGLTRNSMSFSVKSTATSMSAGRAAWRANAGPHLSLSVGPPGTSASRGTSPGGASLPHLSPGPGAGGVRGFGQRRERRGPADVSPIGPVGSITLSVPVTPATPATANTAAGGDSPGAGAAGGVGVHGVGPLATVHAGGSLNRSWFGMSIHTTNLVRCLLADPPFVGLVLLVLSAVLGLLVSPLFLTAHLFSIVSNSTHLLSVIRSITKNGRSLLLTGLLAIIVIYIFSVVGFLFFQEDFQSPEHCQSMLSCFAHALFDGIRAGGGIGDLMRPAIPSSDVVPSIVYGMRSSFDFLCYVIVVVILLNIIFGIIVDTFAELRAEKQKIDEDIKTKCFICGIEASEFERHAAGFSHHIKRDHNMWLYIYFLHHLRTKSSSEYTGQESYVDQMIKHHDLTFFPTNHAICLSDRASGENGEGGGGGEAQPNTFRAKTQRQLEAMDAKFADLRNDGKASSKRLDALERRLRELTVLIKKEFSCLKPAHHSNPYMSNQESAGGYDSPGYCQRRASGTAVRGRSQSLFYTTGMAAMTSARMSSIAKNMAMGRGHD